MPTYRLSGYPAATEVSARIAFVNSAGTGMLSVAKTATPGAAAGSAPTLWGSIAHGAELSANSLDVSAWSLDNATEDTITADSPYTAPRRVITSDFFGRKNTTVSTLTAGVIYPFVVMFKPGTSNAMRLVIRYADNGGEARVLVAAGLASVSVAYSATSIGTISNTLLEALADGFYRLSGYFTPSLSVAFLFGVGPNDFTGASTDINLYGGALAAPIPPDPEPDPDTVPTTMTLDQFGLADAATDGETLLLSVIELPFDGGSALTGLFYRVNGGSPLPVASIATGDYQITVPSLALASVTMHATNALGPGMDSAARTATPTAATALDPAGSDAAIRSNGVFIGRDVLDESGGRIIAINGTTINNDTTDNANGVRVFSGDGSQVWANYLGDLQYMPNGAHDALNASESTVVSITWRRTGDVSDRTYTIRVYGSELTGDDIADGVTPSTSMTLNSAPTTGAVLEVAFTAGGSACTPTFGGVTGLSVPAGDRAVQYFRSTGSAVLTFSTTPANVYARVLNTPGDAATIRRMIASRSGTTLSLDWRTMPRAGFPNTAGWSEYGGTPASPLVLNAATSTAGFAQPSTPITSGTAYIEWLRLQGPTLSFFAHDAKVSGCNSAIKIKGGFDNAFVYDMEMYGPQSALSNNQARAEMFIFWENISNYPRKGVTRIYDTIFDLNKIGQNVNNDAFNGDNPDRFEIQTTYIMNGDWQRTGDSISDNKGFAWFHCMTFGSSWRAARVWNQPNVYGRLKLNGTYTQTEGGVVKEFNLSRRGGAFVLWMTDRADGSRINDPSDTTTSLGLSAFGYVADARQLTVAHAKPAFPPECDYAATDFEFEQSLDGGASWSALSVARTGPNDCWGATRRTITGISTSITHVRARALWGAKVGAWTTAAVTT